MLKTCVCGEGCRSGLAELKLDDLGSWGQVGFGLWVFHFFVFQLTIFRTVQSPVFKPSLEYCTLSQVMRTVIALWASRLMFRASGDHTSTAPLSSGTCFPEEHVQVFSWQLQLSLPPPFSSLMPLPDYTRFIYWFCTAGWRHLQCCC